jgi:hypothetical protein
MNRSLFRPVWRTLASHALPPVVIGAFLLLYIGIAFNNDDALMALIGIAGSNMMLISLFALIPVNRVACMLEESRNFLAGRQLLRGKKRAVQESLFDETVELEGVGSGFSGVERRLSNSGYHTVAREDSLVAWRGISTFPARALFLAASALLFCGVLISLSGRVTYRGTVIEGEKLPTPTGGEVGIVERIVLAKSTGRFLAKTLTMEVAPPERGGANRIFGLYPPARDNGAFVYPRYLGVGLFFRFFAPDMPGGYETHSILSIYPPGKEASEEIPGSPYRIIFSLAPSDDGSDPYMTGRMSFLFKLLKGKEVVLTGKAPAGGEFNQGGYSLSFPDARRLIITDFIHDSGVYLIWISMVLFIVAGCVWAPVKIFSPRREMLFLKGPGGYQAWSRAEGRRRTHAGVFHEALDALVPARHL